LENFPTSPHLKRVEIRQGEISSSHCST
jgi:hypothetical protein